MEKTLKKNTADIALNKTATGGSRSEAIREFREQTKNAVAFTDMNKLLQFAKQRQTEKAV